jgi:hypothetical protein
LEQSNAFSTSPWSLTRATLTSGQSGYDGLTNAWKYTEGTFTANLPVLEQSFTSSSDVETYSFYLKAGTRNWVAISVQGTGYIWINLTDGTVGSAGGGTPPTATTQLVGNGWYLVSVSSTGTKFGINLHITDANNSTSYNGNGTGFVYVQNAQRNIGTTAKPYFPTTDRLNVPRLTYQNGGGGCPSLLLEKQSTNLVTYSEDFSNAAWTKFNASVTANDTTSPDGTQNADKLIENTANDEHVVYRAIDGTSKTFSFYAKAAGRNWLAVLSNNGNYTYFNVSNGTLGTIAATSTATIEDAGNGWYRCTIYNTHATYGAVMNLATANGTVVYTGNGTSGVYLWGAQIEASSYPTSYISTTSASATRVADACSKTGISSLIGQTEGTIFLDYNLITASQDIVVMNAVGLPNNDIAIIFIGNSLEIYCFNNFVEQFRFSLSGYKNTNRYKIAIGYANNNTACYINGSLVGTDTSCSFNLTDSIFYTSADYNAHKINESVLFKTRLTNAELASLTTI